MSRHSFSSLPARSISRAAAPLVNAAARLELLEYFLIHYDDLPGCAQAGLDWLARHAGVRRSICLAIDGDAGMLVGVAGLGVATEDVETYAAVLAHSHDPLVRALTAPAPMTLRVSQSRLACAQPGRSS